MSNLYRGSDEKVIAGVCAGLAHRLDHNMTGLRWVVALVTLFLSGIPAIVCIVLWAILKPRPTGISPRSKTCREAGGYAGWVIDV